MVERIKAIMAHYQLRAAQFSDNIGMQRSAVSHVLSGRNKPSLDFILRIKRNFPEISLNWLTLGEGNMLESNSPSLVPTSGELFTGQQDVIKSVSDRDKDSGEPAKDIVSAAKEPRVGDEDAVYYGRQPARGDIVQVLLVYDNGTFKALKPGE